MYRRKHQDIDFEDENTNKIPKLHHTFETMGMELLKQSCLTETRPTADKIIIGCDCEHKIQFPIYINIHKIYDVRLLHNFQCMHEIFHYTIAQLQYDLYKTLEMNNFQDALPMLSQLSIEFESNARRDIDQNITSIRVDLYKSDDPAHNEAEVFKLRHVNDKEHFAHLNKVVHLNTSNLLPTLYIQQTLQKAFFVKNLLCMSNNEMIQLKLYSNDKFNLFEIFKQKEIEDYFSIIIEDETTNHLLLFDLLEYLLNSSNREHLKLVRTSLFHTDTIQKWIFLHHFICQKFSTPSYKCIKKIKFSSGFILHPTIRQFVCNQTQYKLKSTPNFKNTNKIKFLQNAFNLNLTNQIICRKIYKHFKSIVIHEDDYTIEPFLPNFMHNISEDGLKNKHIDDIDMDFIRNVFNNALEKIEKSTEQIETSLHNLVRQEVEEYMLEKLLQTKNI